VVASRPIGSLYCDHGLTKSLEISIYGKITHITSDGETVMAEHASGNLMTAAVKNQE
jgi:hypothetical protein